MFKANNYVNRGLILNYKGLTLGVTAGLRSRSVTMGRGHRGGDGDRALAGHLDGTARPGRPGVRARRRRRQRHSRERIGVGDGWNGRTGKARSPDERRDDDVLGQSDLRIWHVTLLKLQAGSRSFFGFFF